MTNKETQETTFDNIANSSLALPAMGLILAPIFTSVSPLLGLGIGVGAIGLAVMEFKGKFSFSRDEKLQKIEKLIEEMEFCNRKDEYPKLKPCEEEDCYIIDVPSGLNRKLFYNLTSYITAELKCDDVKYQLDTQPYWLELIYDKEYGPYSNKIFRRVYSSKDTNEYITIDKVDMDNPYYDLVYVNPPLRMTRDHLEAVADMLSSYFRNDVEFYSHNGEYYYKIFKNHLKQKYVYQLGKYKINVDNGLQILVGFSKLGLAWINLSKQNPHTIIGGCTNSGKSNLIHAIMCCLLENYTKERLSIYLADFKEGVELTEYGSVDQVKKAITEVEKLEELLKEIDDERSRRNKLFITSGVKNLLEYNQKYPNNKLPYIMLIVDEVASILSLSPNAKKNIDKLLAKLGQLGRSSGVHVILSTQRPAQDVITPLIKVNFNNRICLAVEDEANSEIIIGTGEGKNLRGYGHGILKRGRDKVEFQGLYIEQQDRDKIIKENTKTPY